MNLTSLLFATCLLSGVLSFRPQETEDQVFTKFVPLFGDPNLSDNQITEELSKQGAMVLKLDLPKNGIFSETFVPFIEIEQSDYIKRHVPEWGQTYEAVQNDMNSFANQVLQTLLQHPYDPVARTFLDAIKKRASYYVMGYLASKKVYKTIGTDFFEKFKAVGLKKIESEEKKTADIQRTVLEAKDNFTEYLIQLRAYLNNKYKLFTKLNELFDKVLSSVEGQKTPLTEDTFMPLNDRAFEFARAMVIAGKARNVPFVPHLVQLLDKLAKSPMRSEKDQTYPKWNALLFRRILQLLADADELDQATEAMKKYLTPSGETPQKTNDNYAALLNVIYHQTNPVFVFDGDSLPVQKRKLFAIDMILNSSPKSDPQHKLAIEQPDLKKMIDQFEKIADVPPKLLEVTKINPQYTDLPENYQEALQNPSFLVMQNDLMNALNAFKVSAKPQELADDDFPTAFDSYLNQHLEDPAANLQRNYPMLKIINAKKFLAPTSAQVEMKPFSPEAAQNLKERIDEPAYEPIKNGLLSLFAADKPIHQKDVDNKEYLNIPETFPAAHLIKEFDILPDEPEKKEEKQTEINELPEDQSPRIHKNNQGNDPSKRVQGTEEDTRKKNLVNVVVGFLPSEIREFLENSDSIFEQLADENVKFAKDYMFAKVKRITSACS